MKKLFNMAKVKTAIITQYGCSFFFVSLPMLSLSRFVLHLTGITELFSPFVVVSPMLSSSCSLEPNHGHKQPAPCVCSRRASSSRSCISHLALLTGTSLWWQETPKILLKRPWLGPQVCKSCYGLVWTIFYSKYCTENIHDKVKRCATLRRWTFRRWTLRLLHVWRFVERFCRITSSSKIYFVECVFVEYDTLSIFP